MTLGYRHAIMVLGCLANVVSYTDRNVSVYKDHIFALRGASASCTLRARILRATSSGAHKFKLRFVIVVADEPNATIAPKKAPRPSRGPPRPGEEEEDIPDGSVV